MMNSPPLHDHSTIGEAGACPECRVDNIHRVDDAPRAFLLTFPDADSPALSLVRDWGDDPLMTAWATGCNLPLRAAIMEIPLGVALESGIEMFRLYEGGDADKAFQVIHELTNPKTGGVR
jgi:hypothetical protein